MRYGSIYLITNSVTGRKYVGQTIFCVSTRWKSHIIDKSDSLIHLAIEKHGVHNFIFEELCSAYNQTDLNYLEEHFIQYHKSYGPYGYNRTFGGNASTGKFTDEVRLKMRMVKLGKERDFYKKRTIIQVNQSGSVKVKEITHAQRLDGEPVLTDYNPSTSPRQPSKYESLKEEIIRIYNESNSSYVVANKFDLDKSHVCRYLKKWGVMRNQAQAASNRNNNRYKLDEKLVQSIKTEYEKDNNLSRVSRDLNVSIKTVRRVFGLKR